MTNHHPKADANGWIKVEDLGATDTKQWPWNGKCDVMLTDGKGWYQRVADCFWHKRAWHRPTDFDAPEPVESKGIVWASHVRRIVGPVGVA